MNKRLSRPPTCGAIAEFCRRLLVPAALAILAGCESGAATTGGAGGGPAEAAGSRVAKPDAKRKPAYPDARRSSQLDDYHGAPVADPYRWLEDVNSPETRAWIAAQNKITTAYLQNIPARQKLNQRLTELWNYEKYGLPTKRGSKYFFTYNDGLQNQSALYVADGLQGEPRLLLDPNGLSEEGTVALKSWRVSEDGKVLAYGLAADGSDWQQWRTLDVESAKPLSDHLQWVKFSDVAWTPDGQGFFYSRYDQPREGQEFTGVNYFQKLYYHRIGDPQEKDRLVYDRPDQKEWGFDGHVTEDGRYLIISVWRGTERKNQLFYLDLKDPDANVVELLVGFDAEYEFVGNEGGEFWVLTDLDAPRRRVVAIDAAAPERENWQELIPESTSVIDQVTVVGERFIVRYLKDARALVQVVSLDGAQRSELELPGIGSVTGFEGKRKDPETFFRFTNFATPGVIYRYDAKTGELNEYRSPKLAFDPGRYQTRQVFYASKDGTRVPMFITHRRDAPWDGSRPALLYGYGGFDIALTPRFSVANLVWMESGGMFAASDLRGGGEYGREWHEAGMLENKQNVFDDFIAAAEWLIENKVAHPSKLAIQGRSNGGLLVGACMTQRPDLYAAALPGVGVMDMLRYHKFTIGWAWVSEYGSSDDPQQFRSLYAYSPLHNLKPGVKYPATLITTADHDDRVVPGHSFKFAAALQYAQAGDAPALIRIETSAGHGAGTPTSKRIDEAADTLAFLFDVLYTDALRQSQGE